MFEFDSSKKILIEENECKPNQYMAKALGIGLIAQTICFVLNELGLFYVDKGIMRVCYALAILCTLIPHVIANRESLCTNPRCKYIVLGCVNVMTFVFALALFIFATPMCMLPMLLAVQYNSRKVSKIAIVGSCVCVAVTPPLGCMLKLWDLNFLEYLLSNGLGAEIEYRILGTIDRFTTVGGIIAFISFPWLLTFLMFSKLILSATQKGEENIKNQIRILEMSRYDALTGLFNQNTYRQFLESEFPGERKAGIIFYDVDGLKDANDSKGHEYGDLLLQRCAASLKPLFDEKCHGFRVGGDEFLVVVDTDEPKILDEKMDLWKKSIDEINRENERDYDGIFCHMSAGASYGTYQELNDLIDKADKKMYEVKEKYHQS